MKFFILFIICFSIVNFILVHRYLSGEWLWTRERSLPGAGEDGRPPGMIGTGDLVAYRDRPNTLVGMIARIDGSGRAVIHRERTGTFIRRRADRLILWERENASSKYGRGDDRSYPW